MRMLMLSALVFALAGCGYRGPVRSPDTAPVPVASPVPVATAVPEPVDTRAPAPSVTAVPTAPVEVAVIDAPPVPQPTAAPVVAPTPEPAATPIAAPAPDPSPSPVEPAAPTAPTPAFSLDGVPEVASGLNTAHYLVPAWGNGGIPGPENGEGAFRFTCAATHNSYDDPIVYPGQPGESHLHTWFGNDKADANSTYESLRTTGDGSCNNVLNRSAYWVPALMNGHGQVVMPDIVSIYYKMITRQSPMCKDVVAKACIALPRGLRYIFGYNMQRPEQSSPAGARWWMCDYPYKGQHEPNIARAAKGCPPGARLFMELSGPPCWNGKDLDSPDHRSHMAYVEDSGACPKTHPYLVPHFVIAVAYIVDDTLDQSGDESATAQTWYLSSDRMPGMAWAVPGTTEHSDWFGAWEQSVMDTWMTNCIDKQLSCSGGDLGNGQQMTTLRGYKPPGKTILVDPPTLPKAN